MTQHEVLDKIADSYNPTLFLVYLVFAVLHFRNGDKMSALKGFLGIVVCYVVLFIDTKLGIWKSVEMDFSTHSAVALALVFFHLHKRRVNEVAFIGFSCSLLIYYLLELYQEYHTVADIVSTCVVIGPLIFLLYRILSIRKNTG